MISYGDMLDTIEQNEPQETTVTEKKGGNEPEKKGDNEPKNKDVESEKEEDDSEDVI